MNLVNWIRGETADRCAWCKGKKYPETTDKDFPAICTTCHTMEIGFVERAGTDFPEETRRFFRRGITRDSHADVVAHAQEVTRDIAALQKQAWALRNEGDTERAEALEIEAKRLRRALSEYTATQPLLLAQMENGS